MDSLMNATTHSTTNRTEPTRPDRELPARCDNRHGPARTGTDPKGLITRRSEVVQRASDCRGVRIGLACPRSVPQLLWDCPEPQGASKHGRSSSSWAFAGCPGPHGIFRNPGMAHAGRPRRLPDRTPPCAPRLGALASRQARQQGLPAERAAAIASGGQQAKEPRDQHHRAVSDGLLSRACYRSQERPDELQMLPLPAVVDARISEASCAPVAGQ